MNTYNFAANRPDYNLGSTTRTNCIGDCFIQCTFNKHEVIFGGTKNNMMYKKMY